MSKRSERMEITSTDLLDSVRCSFEIAVSALVQAGSNLEILGFELTKLEVLAVVDDLRNAITAIDNHKSNTTLLIKETDMIINRNKSKTLHECLNRLRNPCLNMDTKEVAANLADILEILIVMGFDTDSRSLDIDVTNFRPTEKKEGDGA